jgi:transposase
VNLDYHIEIEKHFYSVPFRLVRQEVEARIAARTVEIFHRGKLVATHLRSLRPHRPTTVADHMPSSHRRYRDWTHDRIRREAAAIGPDAAALVDVILRSRPHPEQGFRSCIGILRLAKRFGADRLDAACARALALGTRSYGSVVTILKNRQERRPSAPPDEAPPLLHENIRGAGYYHCGEVMLIHPIVERLRTLGLTAIADAFVELQNTPEAADLPREDWLGLLIDREVTSRDNRRLARRLREA